MKFTHFRNALSGALRANREEDPQKAQTHRERVPKFGTKRELVAGGTIKWKPVDKQAAMMFAKAHWLCLPPQTNTKEQMESVKSVQTQDGKTLYDANRAAKDILGQRAEGVHDVVRESAAELNETCKTLADVARTSGASMHEASVSLQRHLENLRGARMAITGEADKMIRAMTEVRKFFLGPDYKNEMERLEQFVGLCERMEQLKRNGTMDAISEVMLKLAN